MTSVAVQLDGEEHDRRIVAAMVAGSTNAMLLLYDRHGAHVYGLALCMMRDATSAEDVVMDAFSHAWSSARNYVRDDKTVRSWLTSLAHSHAIHAIRDRATLSTAASVGSRKYVQNARTRT